MPKLTLDKYYTPPSLAAYCINQTYKIIGRDNIKSVLEPSAGNGSFSSQIKDCFAVDIEPEGANIEKMDFFQFDMNYEHGRLIIGNPPFGEKNIQSLKFFKKAALLGDFISFILPISQLNNNQQMYDFDLIYSEDLGVKKYSDRDIHCCLNIFKRPPKLHTSPRKYKLLDIEMRECRKARNQFLPENFKYDIGICTWGSVGKEVQYQGQYHQELYIKINNPNVRDDVLHLLKSVDWCSIYYMTKSPRLKQWQIIKYLKEKIPNLG